MAGHNKHNGATKPLTVRMELTRPLFHKLAEVARYFHTTNSAALFACIMAMHTATVGPPPHDGQAPPAPRRVHRPTSSPSPVASVVESLLRR